MHLRIYYYSLCRRICLNPILEPHEGSKAKLCFGVTNKYKYKHRNTWRRNGAMASWKLGRSIEPMLSGALRPSSQLPTTRINMQSPDSLTRHATIPYTLPFVDQLLLKLRAVCICNWKGTRWSACTSDKGVSTAQ